MTPIPQWRDFSVYHSIFCFLGKNVILLINVNSLRKFLHGCGGLDFFAKTWLDTCGIHNIQNEGEIISRGSDSVFFILHKKILVFVGLSLLCLTIVPCRTFMNLQKCHLCVFSACFLWANHVLNFQVSYMGVLYSPSVWYTLSRTQSIIYSCNLSHDRSI